MKRGAAPSDLGFSRLPLACAEKRLSGHKRGSGEGHQGTPAIVSVRDGGRGLKEGGGSGSGEKQPDSGDILEVKLTGCADRLDVGYERKEPVQDDSQVCG